MTKKYLIILTLVLLIPGCSVWNNFTTYFNLYYNTSKTFDQAEQLMKDQKKPLFAYEETGLPGNSSQLFTTVIEKCSKILQFHKNTAYVDDALLMVGKSFFYQKNYTKALRNFNELKLSLPNSDLILENELWIGKSEVMLRNSKKAEEILLNLIDTCSKAKEYGIASSAYVELTKLKMMNNLNVEAEKYITEFLEISRDDDKRSEASYQLGKLYLLDGKNEDAIKVFEAIGKYSPPAEIDFNARLELGKTLRQMNQPSKALDVFNTLNNQIKFNDKKDIITLQTAITYVDLQRFDEAATLFKKVDTAYVNTPSSSIAKFKLAELFETYYNKYDSAASYYQRSSSTLMPKEYLDSAITKDQLFKKYITLSTFKNTFQKFKAYTVEPEIFIQDSIKYADTIKALQLVDVQKAVWDSVNNPGTKMNRIVNNHPEIPMPQRPTISLDSINSFLVKNKFDLGNLFFTELNRLDSAYFYYNNILTEHKGCQQEGRVLFALGSYYLATNDSVKADSIFNVVYANYKNDNIVNAAAVQLKKPLIDLNKDPMKEKYIEAEKLMQNKEYEVSLQKFYEIFKESPKSSYAPKALYASGYILENNLHKPDSASVMYDSLLVNYSQTPYTQAVMNKLMTYKQEKDRIKKANEDSLRVKELKKNELIAQDSVKNSQSKLKNKIESFKRPGTDSTNTRINKSNVDISKNTVIDSLHKKNNIIPDSILNKNKIKINPDSSFVPMKPQLKNETNDSLNTETPPDSSMQNNEMNKPDSSSYNENNPAPNDSSNAPLKFKKHKNIVKSKKNITNTKVSKLKDNSLNKPVVINADKKDSTSNNKSLIKTDTSSVQIKPQLKKTP